MTAPNKPQDDLETLLDAFLEELMSMTVQEVLDGEDPAAVQARGLAMLSKAKQEAARGRLAAAKAGLAIANADQHSTGNKAMSGAEAKAFLREAANSNKYTLAARKLEEMSDEAAIMVCQKLLRLGAKPTEDSDDP
jgi:hypothetical protein